MKSVLFIVLAFVTSSTFAGSPYVISARKTTVEKTKESGKLRVPGKFEVELDRDTYQYTFAVRNVAPANPVQARLQYIVYLEGDKGRVVPATHGTLNFEAALGKTAEVSSGPFTVKELDVDGPRARGKTVRSTVKGYASRVIDSSGKTMATRYSSSDIERNVDWKILEAKKPSHTKGALVTPGKGLRSQKKLK